MAGQRSGPLTLTALEAPTSWPPGEIEREADISDALT
jgi:hypothetical protein